jgi:hypothetical protein
MPAPPDKFAVGASGSFHWPLRILPSRASTAENHFGHVPVPEMALILEAMTRCFGSRYADASVIGLDIRDA